MTAAKHTPGPWFVVDGCNGRWPGGCEIAIDDREGGNEERDYFLASVVHGDPDELLANARLVAAAPAMHGALIEAAQAAQEAFAEALRYVPEGSCVPPWITRLEQAAERAHAALVLADERFKPTGEPT